ncbi:membrane-spanning 4-domains subfamily A member 14 [Marmota monax]|uniref:membrane-spanning 4-domains subfamily A member 14 n=1 Tax=Marmota monax TaxID=9995 RepID=UPI001EB06E0F|nr:membrane-spanning 4-domains subfamily A member 14 [Marmota monax]
MGESSQEKRGADVITVHPHETVLAALPFGPHVSLLDFLKGEPKILGGIQILLALIMVGLGTVLLFGYISLSKIFPLVFLSGYPFWGAFIFFLTGSVTVINEKLKNTQIPGIITMNVISSAVAVAGIALILISFTHQHKFCQMLSLDGSCVLGKTFFIGILSILLIITIAELGISVTIASFRSKLWTSSDEVVFFLPSDVTPNSEQLNPEENTVLQFELQEESPRIDRTLNRQTVFIGGYSFFKLRVLKSPLVQHCMLPTCNKCKGSKSTSSAPIPEEDNLNDQDMQYVMTQSTQTETQLPQKKALPTKDFLAPPVQTVQALPADDLPSQALLIEAPPEPVMLYATPPSHISQSLDLTFEDMPSQDVLTEERPSQDTIFQEITSTQTTSQDMVYNALSAQATPSYSIRSSKIKQPSQDLEPQGIPPQRQQSLEMLYRDIRAEVMEQIREWKSQDQHPRHFFSFHKPKDGKHRKRFSLELPGKSKQSPRRYSLDLQSKGRQSLKRKSLDQKIKAWLSARRQSLKKQAKYTQTTEQFSEESAEHLQTEGKPFPKEQSKHREDKEQQVAMEQIPKKQTQVKQAEDQQVQEEESPKEQSQNRQANTLKVQIRKTLKQMYQDSDTSSQEHKDGQFLPKPSLQCRKQNWQNFNQQSEDWRGQGRRNKDWIARDWQSEKQHALHQKTLEILEKQSLKQKGLCQEIPSQGTPAQYNLSRQFQGKDQKETQSKVALEEDKPIKDIKEGKPTNLQLEEMNPDFQPSSSHSLVQDTDLNYLSNIDSEQEVQHYASASSNSYKDLNITSSSCWSKDQLQSEESD